MTLETIVTELILNSGNARNYALEAIQFAEQGDFEAAEEKMKNCDEILTRAHEFHTKLLFNEASGESVEAVTPNLILIHGQDHLMAAMTIRDVSQHMIQLCKMILLK